MSVRDWLRDCFGRRMKWLEEAIERGNGGVWFSWCVHEREREREVFEILKGGAKPNQGMRVQ